MKYKATFRWVTTHKRIFRKTRIKAPLKKKQKKNEYNSKTHMIRIMNGVYADHILVTTYILNIFSILRSELVYIALLVNLYYWKKNQ